MNTVKSWFIHWKTSLAGIVAASANLYAQGHSISNVLISAGLAVLGLMSSDADKAAPAK
jgi:hypothetical protein